MKTRTVDGTDADEVGSDTSYETGSSEATTSEIEEIASVLHF